MRTGVFQHSFSDNRWNQQRLKVTSKIERLEKSDSFETKELSSVHRSKKMGIENWKLANGEIIVDLGKIITGLIETRYLTFFFCLLLIK